jgi:hypothetical protein
MALSVHEDSSLRSQLAEEANLLKKRLLNIAEELERIDPDAKKWRTMSLGFLLFVAYGLILPGACSIFIAEAEGKGTQSVTDLDVGNKQVLVDTFRNLVRYAMLRTNRDVTKFGVTPGNFSVEAVDESLAARSNAEISGERSPLSVTRLLEKAHGPSLTFHFYWKAPFAREPLEAAFGLSYEPDGDLKVRLLWLGLPERVPISPRIGVVDGRKPLEEAVAELLRFIKGGRLAPYPPPK